MLMLNLKRKLGSRLVKQGDRTMLMLNFIWRLHYQGYERGMRPYNVNA